MTEARVHIERVLGTVRTGTRFTKKQRLAMMLVLPMSATQPDFRKAYLKIVRWVHPDKTSEPKAELAFKALDGLYKEVGESEHWPM